MAIFPGAPTAEQIQYCSGDSVTLWQRLGVSLLLTLVTLKTTALAAGTFTFPIWYPSLRAALRNRSIKGKYRQAQPCSTAWPPGSAILPAWPSGNAECACKAHIASQNEVILPVFTTAAGNAIGGWLKCPAGA